jgi:Fe2+ or Zn2+ uptake regulation protein
MADLVHASADQVCEELAKRGLKVTQASVYNILTQLADYRIYGRRLSATNKMYFDVLVRPHVHLYDRQNQYYRDVVDEELVEEVNAHLKRRRFRGYTIESIDIQFVVRPTGRGKKK